MAIPILWPHGPGPGWPLYPKCTVQHPNGSAWQLLKNVETPLSILKLVICFSWIDILPTLLCQLGNISKPLFIPSLNLYYTWKFQITDTSILAESIFSQSYIYKDNLRQYFFYTSPRGWSLITRRVGYKTGGGACEVLPLQKGGHKNFSHAEGGTQKV